MRLKSGTIFLEHAKKPKENELRGSRILESTILSQPTQVLIVLLVFWRFLAF